MKKAPTPPNKETHAAHRPGQSEGREITKSQSAHPNAGEGAHIQLRGGGYPKESASALREK
jgi:hypothetical protein